MPGRILTWKGAGWQGNTAHANVEGIDLQEDVDLEDSDVQEDASLEGTNSRGDSGLEDTIYPGHSAFSPTPEHFFQLPTNAGHQFSQ